MIDELVETWRINNRINLKLIDAVSKEGMKCTLSRRGGRNVVRQFTHLHWLRVYQLEKRAKMLADGVRRFDPKDEPAKTALKAAFNDSSKRVEEWFRMAHQGLPGFRTLKRGLASTVGYLIAHESHHRGSIMLTLKQCGHPVDKAVRDGIWDWNNR